MDNQTDNVFGVDESTELIEESTDEQSEEATKESTQEENLDSQEEQPNEEKNEEVTDSQEEQPEQLIDGRFKNTDDLLKAYKNLQGEYTRIKQQPQQSQPTNSQKEQSEVEEYEEKLVAWYQETVKTDPVRANAGLAQYMARKQIDAQMSEINTQLSPIFKERESGDKLKYATGKYEDFYEYKQEISEELQNINQNEPDRIEESTIYETAYLRAANKKLKEQSKNAFENGKKAALKSIQGKKQIHNEQPTNNEEDILPEGLNIIPGGDGIFL